MIGSQRTQRIADPSASADFSPPPLPSPTPARIATQSVAGGPTPRPKPTPKPTPTPEVTKYSSEEIYHLIDDLSGQLGVDPNVIRHIAVCESGFNPLSVNGKYAGLFQFDALTWRTNRQSLHLDANPALRLDAQEAIHTAVYLVSIRGGSAWPNCYPNGSK